MKACLLLQRRFAYAGHAMALTLQKKYGITDFCGYVYLRSSLEFLKSQKEINYAELLLEEDVFKQYENEPLDLAYLNSIEKEYGIPNLWPYIEIDRIVRHGQFLREYPHDTPKYSHEDIMRIIQIKARTIIDFLERQKPDFILFSVINDTSSFLLYHIAKKKNIKTLFTHPGRVKMLYSITEDYKKLYYIEEAFNKIRNEGAFYPKHAEQAKIFLEDFRKTPEPHSFLDSPKSRAISRAEQFSFLSPGKIINSLRWNIKLFVDYFFDPNKDDYDTIKPWYFILDRLKRKIRVLIGYDDLYDQINFKEDFAFFPLQFEPEMASSLFSPFYQDSLWLAKQIARSLPIHFKLYVKEHPSMFSYRTRAFYKELKKIPNVKLINPSEMSFGITQKSKIVITAVGTAGWEAVLMRKPVITLGDAFYNILPMVKKCRAIEDLPAIVASQLGDFYHDEKILVDFITAIYKECVIVNMAQLWNIEGGSKMEKKEKELAPFVDLIAEKLGLKSIE